MNRFPPRRSLTRLASLAAIAFVAAPCLLLAGCADRSGRPATAASSAAADEAPPNDLKPAAAQDGGPGLQLLQQAARAGSDVSYRGVEMVSSMGVNGNTTMVANVWHRSGGNTLVQSASDGTAGSARPVSLSDDTNSQAPEGVLGLTGQLVALLGSNYDLAYVGASSVDNRPALVVQAVREDGTLAAQFWLDSATKLPLRREVYDSSANLIGEDVFIDLTVGSAVAQPAAASASAVQRLTAVDVTQMRNRGWPVPGELPGKLALFQAGDTTTSSGTVLDLGYSDGLFVVSIFVQRGDLAPKLTGYQKITLDGRDVYAGQPDQRSVTWAGQGFVFTVMADAPPAALDKAVDALPYDAPPGFWGRLSNGFGRLARLANPFR
ncbi:MAG TPA: sigma-E factor regulatory protein RseB domain-containing protein [Streptosporangiaceae bacterium]|nr:sigma-E factor regulatory protein RseB domain-containing protein [Streptosporangiaceae bacterium]